jgi:hypothetical protein
VIVVANFEHTTIILEVSQNKVEAAENQSHEIYIIAAKTSDLISNKTVQD